MDQMTIILAQVFGVFMCLIGLSILARAELYRTAIAEFAEQPLLRIVVAAMELMASLFLILLHPIWNPLPAAIISIIGYIAAIEAVFYLTASNDGIRALVRIFDHRVVYTASSVLCIIIGLYLASAGFGWLPV